MAAQKAPTNNAAIRRLPHRYVSFIGCCPVKIGLGLLIKKGRVVIQTEDAALAGGGERTSACRCMGPVSEATETDYTSDAAREASDARNRR
jgi:hypothetical protein